MPVREIRPYAALELPVQSTIETRLHRPPASEAALVRGHVALSTRTSTVVVARTYVLTYLLTVERRRVVRHAEETQASYLLTYLLTYVLTYR